MNIGITLTEYGIYLLNTETLVRKQNSQSPKDYFYSSVQETIIDRVTDKIPLTAGVAFGIKYMLSSENESESIPLIVRVLHPELENPETNFTFTETIQHKTIVANSQQLEFYTFDYPWEMIPGFWTFQIECQSLVILTKEFEIYAQPSAQEEEEVFFYDL